MLFTPYLHADVVLFHDLANQLTVSVTDPVREQVFGGGAVTINAPAGATLLGGNVLAEFDILEPGTVLGSSPSLPLIGTLNLDKGTTSVVAGFSLALPGAGTGCLAACIVADGTIQTIDTLPWSDGTTDTIQLIVETPEPSGLLLLSTAMLAFWVSVRRRRRFRLAPPTRLGVVKAG